MTDYPQSTQVQKDLIGKRFNVSGFGDKGWVELIDFMPSPTGETCGDNAIISAARTSYLGESKGEEADKKLLRYLMKNRHTSPTEMVEFKFRIRAPLLCWWQIVRHRTASMNLQSGRYTLFEENDFYIPQINQWRMQSETNHQGTTSERLDVETQKDLLINLVEDDYIPFNWFDLNTNNLTEDESEVFNMSYALDMYCQLGYKLYQTLIDNKVGKEQARLFLPGFSVYYTGVFKMDAHNLMHLLALRMANEAQWEIRQYARVIYQKIFKVMLPWTAEYFDEFTLSPQGIDTLIELV